MRSQLQKLSASLSRAVSVRRKREQLALSAEQTLLQMGQIAGKELLADTVSDREKQNKCTERTVG